MHQLFQIRTVDRTYFSFRMSDISKDFYKNKRFYFTNAKTCEFVNSYKDFKEVIDNYNYNALNIIHKRSEPLDFLPFYFRNLVREFREEYKDHENLKRPTDIIIFTDSYSYSATCGLIKGFQNTGGTIIVGYYGNPKIEGIDLFDGSQSISSIEKINNFYLYNKLYDLGFYVAQVTAGESFDDSVNDINPIPREYAFDPVDYRVNIYSSYSDDIYMDFIEEGKKFLTNSIMKIIVIQKMINYYYILIVAKILKDLNMHMVVINVKKIKIDGIQVNANLIIVILDIILIKIKNNVLKNVVLMTRKAILYMRI